MPMTREELRDALAVLIDVFKNPHGTLTPDYGEICGDGFQMMTMHPDPVAVANALSRLPDILASLDTEAVKAEREAQSWFEEQAYELHHALGHMLSGDDPRWPGEKRKLANKVWDDFDAAIRARKEQQP